MVGYLNLSIIKRLVCFGLVTVVTSSFLFAATQYPEPDKPRWLVQKLPPAPPQVASRLLNEFSSLRSLCNVMKIDTNPVPSSKSSSWQPLPYESQLPRLHKAALYGNLKAIRTVLQGKPSARSDRDSFGKLALHYAVIPSPDQSKPKTYDITQKLIDSLLHGTYKSLIDTQDGFGLTALHIAAQFKHKDAVKLLIMKGANPCIYSKTGLTVWDRHEELLSSVIQALRNELFFDPLINAPATEEEALIFLQGIDALTKYLKTTKPT